MVLPVTLRTLLAIWQLHKMTNPVEQIIEIYQKNFWWRKDGMDESHLRGYLWLLIDRGNIFWAVDGEKVIGVCETWCVDYDLLGRIVCKQDVIVDAEDTESGNIALVSNVWIDPEYRKGSTIKAMKREWYRRYHHCEYFCGHAQRKTVGMFKAFKVSELKSDLFRLGV